jgi:hypothetical protein
MINGHPTEEELRNRIARQLEWRGPSEVVALIWRGYLAGLLEWGVIEIDIYDRITALLPRVGSKELDELFSDEPITVERENELDEYARKLNNSKNDEQV